MKPNEEMNVRKMEEKLKELEQKFGVRLNDDIRRMEAWKDMATITWENLTADEIWEELGRVFGFNAARRKKVTKKAIGLQMWRPNGEAVAVKWLDEGYILVLC